MPRRWRLGCRFHVWQSNINYFYANTQFNGFFNSLTQLQSLCKNWWYIDQASARCRPGFRNSCSRPMKAMTKTRTFARTERARTRASWVRSPDEPRFGRTLIFQRFDQLLFEFSDFFTENSIRKLNSGEIWEGRSSVYTISYGPYALSHWFILKILNWVYFQLLKMKSLFLATLVSYVAATEFRAVWIATVSNIDWPSRRDLTGTK